MAEWWQKGRNFERRLLLMLYVHILVHSGLRPGTESDGLRWCGLERFAHRPLDVDARLLEDTGAEWLELGLKGSGIDHRPTDGGKLYSLEITARGKTGTRKLVPTRCCQFPFFVLREGHPRRAVDDTAAASATEEPRPCRYAPTRAARVGWRRSSRHASASRT